jgi:hypothetical protein
MAESPVMICVALSSNEDRVLEGEVSVAPQGLTAELLRQRRIQCHHTEPVASISFASV